MARRSWDSRRRLLLRRLNAAGIKKVLFRDARRAERVQYAGAVVLAENRGGDGRAGNAEFIGHHGRTHSVASERFMDAHRVKAAPLAQLLPERHALVRPVHVSLPFFCAYAPRLCRH